jgi:PAS domain S-box-containing protein
VVNPTPPDAPARSPDGAARALQLLIVDQVRNDVERIEQALESSGLDFQTEVADSGATVRARLEGRLPDVIIADDTLPGSVRDAVTEVVRARCPEVPVILATDAEPSAVELLQWGATDFVTRDHLERLVPAIRGALTEPKAATSRSRLGRDVAGAIGEAAEAFTLLETLLAKAPVGFAFVDLDLRLRRINESLAAFTGSKPADMLDGRLPELLPGWLWDQLDPLFTRAIRGEAIANFELHGPASAVGLLSALANLYPVRVAGELRGVGVIVVDISERMRADERFHTVVDSLVDPLYILSALRDGTGAIVDFRFDYANAAACALAGATEAELVGSRLLEAAPDAAGFVELYAKAMETREPIATEFEYIGELGTSGHVELSLDVSVVAYNGGVVASIRDVSDRYRSEALRRASEARFRSLIQHSTDMVLVVGSDGSITYASPAVERLLGYRVPEVLQRSIWEFIHPDDLAMTTEALRITIETVHGVADPITYRVRHRSGAWRWVESTGQNLLADPAVGGVVVNARDVTHTREASLALAEVNRVLRTVTAADEAVVHATSEVALLEDMCRVIVEAGGYPAAWIAVPDPDRPGRAFPVAASEGVREYLDRVMAAYGWEPVLDGPATRALATLATHSMEDVSDLPPGVPLREISLEFGYLSQIALPLMAGDVVVGALSIHATEPRAFDREEVELFEQLARNLAFGVASVRTRADLLESSARLRDNVSTMVATVAATAEARDPYTAGHQRRVADLAGAIGEDLGLDEQTILGIRAAAGIHDVGKIAIPAEILTKPGKLSSIEFEIIKSHAQAGYDIVKGIDFPWPVARMILEHHERLDGSGYPNGLRGDDILLGSRIVAVADVVEAMSSHRPYRPSRGIEAALAQIEEEAGTRLDRDAVDVCLRLFREGRFAFVAD